MAIHAHHRREPQGVGTRIDNPNRDGDVLSSSIFNPGDGAIATDAPLATAPEVTVYTTATGAFAVETVVDGRTITTTTSGAVPITNSAAFASIVSSESAHSAYEAAAKTSSSAATSSSASSDGSSSNLGTLIPAIVVPIVVVLLVSFGGFWFWMRRRHRKQLQNTDFAMAGKGEKLSSRSNSSRSGNPTTAAEKSLPAVNVTELSPPQAYTDDGSRNSFDAIGMPGPGHRTQRSRDTSGTRSPNMPFGSRDDSHQNFSGPRPNTARNRPPPSRHEPQGRNRSNSSPGNRGPPPGSYRGPRGPPPPRDIGPSPIMRNHPSPNLGSGLARGPSPHSQPRPAPAPPGAGKMRAPSPTMASGLNRSNAPPALATNPPPGAFNGASPISQYSPIVKETPNIGTVATFGNSPPKSSSRDGSRPPPINTTDMSSAGAGLGLAAVAISKDKSRSPSPRSPEESFLTEENMRIARLANSSRLGFNQTSKPTSPGPTAQPPRDFSKPLGFKKGGPDRDSPLLPLNIAHSAPGQSPAATSTTNPSPKLPPPATLSQLIPSDSPRDERKPQWNYFGNSKTESVASSLYSGLQPAPLGHNRPLPASRNGPVTNNHSRDDDNKSEVSDLDAYEDIDAKSDVSSLNEFERFDFDSRAGSTRGSGSVR